VAGMRTHVEASFEMARRYMDESRLMLPGIERIIGSPESRAALWCGSFAPDWWGTKEKIDKLHILSTVKTVVEFLEKIPLAPKALLDQILRVIAELENLPPLPQADYAHFQPFTLRYADWLREHGYVDKPESVAFWLGIACHTVEDLSYHMEGPDFPYTDVQPPAVEPYTKDGNKTEKANRQLVLGQDPSLRVDPPWQTAALDFQTWLAKLMRWSDPESTHDAIDAYLVQWSAWNETVNQELERFFATDRAARYHEMFQVYQAIQKDLAPEEVFTVYVKAHTAFWTLEQLWFGGVGTWYRGLPESERVLIDEALAPIPWFGALFQGDQLSRVPEQVYDYFYGGLLNEAATSIVHVRRWYAYLHGSYVYQSEIPFVSPYPYDFDEVRFAVRQPIRYVPYLGTRDTTILSSRPENNAGYEPLLAVGRTRSGSDVRGLLRFELTNNVDATRNLSPQAIEEATLWLYLANPQHVSQSGRRLAVYQVKRAWSEGATSTDGVNGFAGAKPKDANDATWVTPWAKPGCDDPKTDRAESPATQTTITPVSAPWEARMGQEMDHGVWHHPYAAGARFTVAGRNYMIGQDLHSLRAYTQELLPGGKLATREAYGKEWHNRYPVLVPYQREGHTYVFAHGPDSDNRWFIAELLPDGTVQEPETDHGNWNHYYGSCCLVKIGERTFVSGQDLSSHRWFIQELLPGGKLDRYETDHQNWNNPYPVLRSYNAPDGTAYLFGHNPDSRRWFISRFSPDGKIIDPETDHGFFAEPCAAACVLPLGERNFLFRQDLQSHRWFLQELLPDGKLAARYCDTGEWHNPYAVVAEYSADGRVFLFGHNPSSGNNWFIQEVGATGVWVRFDVSALVKRWVAPAGTPTEPNHGVLLVEQDTSGDEPLRFYSAQAWSSEYGELGAGERVARRPLLVVKPATGGA